MSRNTTPRTGLVRKFRSHRQNREFEQALRTASPSMQQELLAAATRTTDLAR